MSGKSSDQPTLSFPKMNNLFEVPILPFQNLIAEISKPSDQVHPQHHRPPISQFNSARILCQHLFFNIFDSILFSWSYKIIIFFDTTASVAKATLTHCGVLSRCRKTNQNHLKTIMNYLSTNLPRAISLMMPHIKRRSSLFHAAFFVCLFSSIISCN